MLPAKLNEKDIKAIVKHLYKGNDECVIKLLTGTGFYYDEHIAAVERLVKRAKYFAKLEKTQEPIFEHFQEAFMGIK